MNKINELLSEVKLERLGRDILAEIIGFNQDTGFEYIDVQKVDKSVLSNIADSMIVNHSDELIDFLLWKHSYKDQIEDSTYQSMLDAVTYNLSCESSNYIWDINSEKYLLKIPQQSTLVNLDFVESVIKLIIDNDYNNAYIHVRNKDTKLDLENEDDKSLCNKILTCSNLETDISKIDNDILNYQIKPAINEYLESKGYIFDNEEDRYYIHIDEEKKYSIMKKIIEDNFISYTEDDNVFTVLSGSGKAWWVYIDSCSQYTVSNEYMSYEFNEVDDFLEHLENISVKKLSYIDMNNFILKKALHDENISYEINSSDEFIVNTTSGTITLYIDTQGLYCLEDSEGSGICRDNISSFIEYISNICTDDKNDSNSDDILDTNYVTLECTTHYSSKHRWVLQETRTFDDANNGGMIDSHLQILDLNQFMRFVSDDELNKLGYDDVWDVEWVILNQSSNKIAK